jgi:hypothetical protein
MKYGMIIIALAILTSCRGQRNIHYDVFVSGTGSYE